MSQLYVDNIKGRTGGAIGAPSGVNATGVVTATTFKGTSGEFTGNVSIGGTLTYEDVTNIDAVGVVTAQQGIRIGTGGTVGPVGSGIVTYFGDGSNLTGVVSGIEVKSGGTSVGTSLTAVNFSGATVSIWICWYHNSYYCCCWYFISTKFSLSKHCNYIESWICTTS